MTPTPANEPRDEMNESSVNPPANENTPADAELESYLSEHHTLKGLYDDDRSIRVESGVNGELTITIGNQTPVFVFAEDFRALVDREADSALAALPADATRLVPQPAGDDLDATAERAHSVMLGGEPFQSNAERERWRDVVRATRLVPHTQTDEALRAENERLRARLAQSQARFEAQCRQGDDDALRLITFRSDLAQARRDLEEANQTTAWWFTIAKNTAKHASPTTDDLAAIVETEIHGWEERGVAYDHEDIGALLRNKLSAQDGTRAEEFLRQVLDQIHNVMAPNYGTDSWRVLRTRQILDANEYPVPALAARREAHQDGIEPGPPEGEGVCLECERHATEGHKMSCSWSKAARPEVTPTPDPWANPLPLPLPEHGREQGGEHAN